MQKKTQGSKTFRASWSPSLARISEVLGLGFGVWRNLEGVWGVTATALRYGHRVVWLRFHWGLWFSVEHDSPVGPAP